MKSRTSVNYLQNQIGEFHRLPISIAGLLADLATCSTKSLIDVFAAGVFRAALPPPGLPRPADGSCVAP